MKVNVITLAVIILISGCQLESKNKEENFDPAKVARQVRDLNLTATAYNKSVTLNWEAPQQVSGFMLYSASESMATLTDLSNINALKGGQVVQVEGSNHQLNNLNNGQYYYFTLTGKSLSGQRLRSKEIQILVRDQSIAFQSPINDSGRLTPENYVASCDNQHQDCGAGRDATDNDNSDGYAGFSFTKLDQQGRDLAASAGQWHCVRDNVTGLVWEVKTDHADPQQRDQQDKRWIYTYFNNLFVDADGTDGPLKGATFNGTDGIYGGKPDKGIRSGEDRCGNVKKVCTTEQYVKDVNAIKPCGFSDWRLPRFSELYSLKILQGSSAEIDTDYFPHTQQRYLTSDYFLRAVSTGRPDEQGNDEIIGGSAGLLSISFNGEAQYWQERTFGSLRLVRGGQ